MLVKVLKDNDLIINGAVKKIGDELDLPEDFANRLVANGVVEVIGGKSKSTNKPKKSFFSKPKEEEKKEEDKEVDFDA